MSCSVKTLERSYVDAAHGPSTYGHRSERTEDPVRSPVLKLRTGGLVVEWVTISESPLLYVFAGVSFFARLASGAAGYIRRRGRWAAPGRLPGNGP